MKLFSKKQLTNKTGWLFVQKTPSYLFDRVLKCLYLLQVGWIPFKRLGGSHSIDIYPFKVSASMMFLKSNDRIAILLSTKAITKTRVKDYRTKKKKIKRKTPLRSPVIVKLVSHAPSFLDNFGNFSEKHFFRSTSFLRITTLREKCLNTEFFLVRIFLYSVQIQENTDHRKLPTWTLHVVQQLLKLHHRCLTGS